MSTTTRRRRCWTTRTSTRTRPSAWRSTRWTGTSRPSWCPCRHSRMSAPARPTLASRTPILRTGRIAISGVSVIAFGRRRTREREGWRDRETMDDGRDVDVDLQHSLGLLPTTGRLLRRRGLQEWLSSSSEFAEGYYSISLGKYAWRLYSRLRWCKECAYAGELFFFLRRIASTQARRRKEQARL